MRMKLKIENISTAEAVLFFMHSFAAFGVTFEQNLI